MADILIKGMEMPKSCGDCPFLYDHDACYVSGMWSGMRFMLLCFNGHTDEYRLGEFPFKEKRVDWCPLAELPPEENRLYVCDPSKADGCSKTGCAYTGGAERGDCMLTTRLEWALMEVQTDGKL